MCKVIVCENSFSTESRKRNSIEMWVLRNGVSGFFIYILKDSMKWGISGYCPSKLFVVVPLKPDEKRVMNHTRDTRWAVGNVVCLYRCEHRIGVECSRAERGAAESG